MRIHGKGGTVRTVLLDDRGYFALLRLYLARAGYTAGPLFRASINGSGGPLSYDAAHHRWEGYCSAAGVGLEIHQLRHAHATELINSGVSIEAVRRRLGHASTETTQLYALLNDKVADAEIRAARLAVQEHRRTCSRMPTGPDSSSPWPGLPAAPRCTASLTDCRAGSWPCSPVKGRHPAASPRSSSASLRSVHPRVAAVWGLRCMMR